MEHRWWQAHIDYAEAVPEGQPYWRYATPSEEKYWRTRLSGDFAGAQAAAFADSMKKVNAAYAEGAREVVAVEATMAAGPVVGGISRLERAFRLAAVFSGTYEAEGVPFGDPVDPERFAKNTLEITAATVALGKAWAVARGWLGRLAAKTPDKVVYIGKLRDLEGIPPNQTLLPELPNLGNPKANYYQNMSVLRRKLWEGYEVRDASKFRLNADPDPMPGWLDRTLGQSGLGAERNLLSNKGLKLNPATGRYE